MIHLPRNFVLPLLIAALFWCTPAGAGSVSHDEVERFAAWVKDMKASPKGPFHAIRWFCKDGTVITSVPGKGYSCVDHGGGVQHGEWSERTRAIRNAGYLIANVLADLDAEHLLAASGDDATIKQILIEQYLISADDGWIMRGARYYRGALQMEGERRSARRLLRTMLLQPAWRKQRFALLREAARLLPHQPETTAMTTMRSLSSTIAAEDPGFARLRDKLHNLPDAGDADTVRSYAKQRGIPSQAGNYARLAVALDQIYRVDAAGRLRALAAAVTDRALARDLREAVAALAADHDPRQRFAASATMMTLIRDELARFGSPGLMLDALDASIALEIENYSAANVLRAQIDGASRRQLLRWLRPCLDALYGAGLLSPRERRALHESLQALDRDLVELDRYEIEMRHLARAPSWGERGLRFYFDETVAHIAGIEQLARGYFHDRLRGSPLLFFGTLMTRLLTDADRLAGIRHELFGRSISAGVRALNPGLARGPLLTPDSGPLAPDGIYIVEETQPDLLPVAGLLTAGAGNPVSHVQLLARNLGIPNVLVTGDLLDSLRTRSGQRVVLAVSPRGTVRMASDGPQWDAIFGKTGATDVLIEADVGKLDLQRRDLVGLVELRAADAGRSVGPKAANLGELKHHYPATVAAGVVLPMGVFRQLLDRPLHPGGPTVWQWMRQQYAALDNQSTDPQDSRAAPFLAQLRAWILAQEFDAAFVRTLRAQMERAFGPDGSYGVFVRSDTNIEDLPGFTGAGLNLTVPNVVGFDNILDAIRQVWASPFTERAYRWRQARMRDPALVFPSVLLLRSVPVDKSGVLVTHDIDSGDDQVISIAVNEGIGGAVAGQAAEELRVDLRSGKLRLMASAAAPYKSVLEAGGGLAQLPASGTERVLTNGEIETLVAFARELPDRFPGARGNGGTRVTMDIEFGFVGGRLALFQIRPLAQNRQAQRNSFLLQLDAERSDTAGRTVNMSEQPE